MSIKKILGYSGLQTYDGNIKDYITSEIDSIPSDVLVVNITLVNNDYTADKTFDEINTAYKNGKNVYCTTSEEGIDYIYPLIGVIESSSIATFGLNAGNDSMIIMLTPDGISIDTIRLLQEPDLDSYETTANASAKLDEAKSYADSLAKNYDVSGSANTALSNAKAYTDEVAETKVDVVSGKGLSTNDYTTSEKTKLAGIDEGANKTTVDSALSSTSTNPVQNKIVNSALSGKVPTSRTVNGKALSSNITLSASDVGADVAGSASTALSSAKTYTDEKIDAIVGEGASTTLDTIGEISAAIEDNQDMLNTLNSAIGNKANASDLTSHTSNASNPHSVTKSQVGLGNVPNVATNDQTPTFTVATTLATLTSGEKLSVAFGKISKAISDLASHIGNKSNPHGVTASQVGADVAGSASSALADAKSYTDEVASGKSDTGHTHNYAGSSSAGGSADSALLVNTVPNTQDKEYSFCYTAGNGSSVIQNIFQTNSGNLSINPSTSTINASNFVGGGASLTSLNASNISSGTLAEARLPLATASAVGGVKVGSNITVSSGTISLTKANVTAALGYTPPTSDTNTDTKVTQAYSTGNALYPVLFSATSGVSSTDSRGDTTARVSNKFYANHSSGYFHAEGQIHAGGSVHTEGFVQADGNVYAKTDIQADGNMVCGGDLSVTGKIVADGQIQSKSSFYTNGYIQSVGNMVCGGTLNSTQSIYTDSGVFTGGKTGYNDGTAGVLINATGRMYMQGVNNTPGIFFYGATAGSASGASIQYNESTDYLQFAGGTRYTFDAPVYVDGTAVSLSGHKHGTLYNSDGVGHLTVFSGSSSYTIRTNHASSNATTPSGYKYYFGANNYRWQTIYSIAALSTTSDLNVKENIEEIPQRYIDMLDDVKPVIYKFKAGDRLHGGYISQWVEESMTKHDITAEEFGGFCKDAKVDENGNIIEGEYDYSLRYAEFLPILHAKVNQIEEKYNKQIEELNLKLAELEAKLN